MLGGSGVLTALAGCSAIGVGGPVRGTVVSSENFEGSGLVADLNAGENTLTIGGTLTNVGDDDRVVTGLFCNYYDAHGTTLVSGSTQLDGSVSLPAGESGEFEVTTEDLGHPGTAARVDSFDAMVGSHTA